MCETPIERWPSQFTDVAFCGESCRSKWLAETFVGPAHPNWKGTEKLAYGPGWNQIRRRAVERDDYRCRLCGTGRAELGQNPDVHHIIPVRWFADSDDHTRIDAHTLDNVISLCRACHRRAEDGDISEGTLRSLIQSESDT
ncbi:HNH endonuclease [Haloarcula amylovorans]|uniref:HNH endonuclease n=1 Tax=Haloarcula amylovorans TaxID=2562280 RepID=UPI001FD853C1|nr:HNH endonuclease signature motif containing protein [Halomicroarcula amylolytica]